MADWLQQIGEVTKNIAIDYAKAEASAKIARINAPKPVKVQASPVMAAAAPSYAERVPVWVWGFVALLVAAVGFKLLKR